MIGKEEKYDKLSFIVDRFDGSKRPFVPGLRHLVNL